VFDSFLDYEKGGKYEGRELKKDNPAIYNPYVGARCIRFASFVACGV
jgi:hypothetical protein